MEGKKMKKSENSLRPLTKKDAMKSNENMLNYQYQVLDKCYCLAWHRATGMLVEEWCNFLEKYAKERGRDLFFAINEWDAPCCFFDATNEKDWKKWMIANRRWAKKWWDRPIAKHWANPDKDIEEGTKQ